MKVKIFPGFAKGEITVPPSKSMLHRAIISASLANGTSKISNVTYSEDILATINAFEQLGVIITKHKDYLEVTSNNSLNFTKGDVINCNESGSTLRFLIPLLSNDKGIQFTGKASLMKRPLSVYKTIYEQNNQTFILKNQTLYIDHAISAGEYKIPGNVSSQFISGLLFSLPLKENNSIIEVTGDFESQNYVNMTIDILKKFGVEITKEGKRFYIKGNQSYHSHDIEIESDYSQLAFFAVAGTINGDIKINLVSDNSLQPDSEIIPLIKKMNGNITSIDGGYHFQKSKTNGITIDVSQHPDIAPILSILAGLSIGKTNIINAKRLKIKETDRLQASFAVLKKLGVQVDMGIDSLSINGQNEFIGSEFDSYNDHRMVMSIAIASLKNKQPIIINNAEAINKSYPKFFEDLQSLGIKIEYK